MTLSHDKATLFGIGFGIFCFIFVMFLVSVVIYETLITNRIPSESKWSTEYLQKYQIFPPRQDAQTKDNMQ